MPSTKKTKQSGKKKTRLCTYWVEARENGAGPPLNAPSWWGCPQQDKCDFAHGIEELRGSGKRQWVDYENDRKMSANSTKETAYLSQLQSFDNDNLTSMIDEGLWSHNRPNKRPLSASSDISKPLFHWISNMTSNQIFTSDVITAPSDDVFHSYIMRRGDDCVYFEVELMTSGVFQIGWADPASFQVRIPLALYLT